MANRKSAGNGLQGDWAKGWAKLFRPAKRGWINADSADSNPYVLRISAFAIRIEQPLLGPGGLFQPLTATDQVAYSGYR